MNKLMKAIIRKVGDGFETLGAMGDASVIIKPDMRPRCAALCRCRHCLLTQMVDVAVGHRTCAGCGNVVNISADIVGHYEVTS